MVDSHALCLLPPFLLSQSLGLILRQTPIYIAAYARFCFLTDMRVANECCVELARLDDRAFVLCARLSLSLSLFLCMYTYMCVYVYMYVYVCVQ